MPIWLPKTRIYYNFDRWGINGLAPVIESRINEAGGNTKLETIADKSLRLQRQRENEQRRNRFLSGSAKWEIANEEFNLIVRKLKTYKTEIENPETQFILGERERLYQLYEFGYQTFFLRFDWTGQYEDGVLTILLLNLSGHKGLDYKEVIDTYNQYKIDMNTLQTIGWSDIETQKFYTTDQLIDKWVTIFLDEVGKRITKRR